MTQPAPDPNPTPSPAPAPAPAPTLDQLATDVENKSAAYNKSKMQAAADKATADASLAAANQAHVDLAGAIATLVSAARSEDPDPSPAAG